MGNIACLPDQNKNINQKQRTKSNNQHYYSQHGNGMLKQSQVNNGEDYESYDKTYIPPENQDKSQNNQINQIKDDNLQRKVQKKYNKLDDFQYVKNIGRGAFGKVTLVQCIKTGKLYAMKAIIKEKVTQKQQKYLVQERLILRHMDNPFIVQLHHAFQTSQRLYFVLDFMQGGELLQHLKKHNNFNEDTARFFLAEIIIALEYLHKKNVIYRDLKPENILLDNEGHIRLTDFGLSKVNSKDDKLSYTICGTPDYLAPEIFLEKGHTRMVDWYAFGILMYEMLTGQVPYYSKDKKQMFKKRIQFPPQMQERFSQDAQDLMLRLLKNDPQKRIGYKGAQEVKDHQFFKTINWEKVQNKQLESPFKPRITHSQDLKNFDPYHANSVQKDTPSKDMQNYVGFSFDEDNDIRATGGSAILFKSDDEDQNASEKFFKQVNQFQENIQIKQSDLEQEFKQEFD